LKPEKVLMDDDGHLSLSFVEIPKYLAPEMIDSKGHGKPVD